MNNHPGGDDPYGQSAGSDRPHYSNESGFSRDEAERQARAAIGNARDELQSLLENQKNAAAQQVQDVAAALRKTAKELRERNQSTVATYVASVADRIDYWSSKLEQRHISRLSEDMKAFANERPALFIAGAVVFGFAMARFLKSSEDDRAPGAIAGAPARRRDSFGSSSSSSSTV